METLPETIDNTMKIREYSRQFYKAKYTYNEDMDEAEREKVKQARAKRNEQARKRYKENEGLREQYRKRNRERYVPKTKKPKSRVIKIVRGTPSSSV
tara:strand:- start:593 stop:883 length:291 start_codon:yes stop_codon:yes gene_type:complete